MDHVAIMKRSWGMVPKILSGEKKIESRWSLKKSSPWGKVREGDKIYFKNCGEPVTATAQIDKVITFANLTPKKVKEILKRFGKDDGIEKNRLTDFFNLFKDKKYCLLIFLKNPQKITPFEINKKGFGAMAAWLTTEKIEDIVI